jgi:hypothetical protein
MLAMVAHFAVASVNVIPIAGFVVVSGTTVALGVNDVSCVYSMAPLVTGISIDLRNLRQTIVE